MILAVIQARMASTRLPGKSMLTLAGKPLIEHVINRVRATKLPMDIVVATTNTPADDELTHHVAVKCGTSVYRGDENDVLSRFYWAAELYPKADCIVRITADDPFKDPALIDLAVEMFLAEWAKPSDKIAPPALLHLGGLQWALGMDVEVMARWALTEAFKSAPDYQREHVTDWIASTHGVWMLRDPQSRSTISTRLTMDDLSDYSTALKLYEALPAGEYSYDATLKALTEIEVASGSYA